MNISSRNNYSPTFCAKPWKAKYSKPFQEALKKKEIVVLDTDIIVGFLRQTAPGDGLPVPGMDTILKSIKKGTKFIKRAKILQINNLDAHKIDDPEHKIFKNFCDTHCMIGTEGAKILPEAKIKSKNHIKISRDIDKKDVPSFEMVDKFRKNGGVIDIQKNTNGIGNYAIDFDEVNSKEIIMRNPKPYKLFKHLKDAGVKAVIVRGVATDYCVKLAVKFLKEMGIRPIVVSDAIKEIQHGINAPEMQNIYGDVITITTKQMNEEIKKSLKK